MRKLNLSILVLLVFAIFVSTCYPFDAALTERTIKEVLVNKDWDKVIESANIWKEQNKTTPVPNFILAYAYYVKGDYQNVSQSLDSIDSQEKKQSLLTWAEEFVNEYPRNPVPYLLNGDVYIRLKKYSEAIKEFDKAEDLAPSFFLVYVEKGMVYSFQNNYDEAIKNFTQAIKLEPNSADIYNNRGIAYFSKGDYTLALEDFNQAIKINPEFKLAYLGRGKVYCSLGKNDFQKVKEITRVGASLTNVTTRTPTMGTIRQQFTDHFEINLGVVKGVDSEQKGRIKKIRKGEVVSEKAMDDNFINSPSYFFLYNGQYLSKREKGN